MALNCKYIFVKKSDSDYINTIYRILKACSLHLAKQFLFHWLPIYSKRAIRKDCETKYVILVKDEILQEYTSTFQMFVNAEGNLYIRKVATLPQFAGRGIGRSNLAFIEEFVRQNNCQKIRLDVYFKSKEAISFYIHNGFVEVGTKRTLRYKERILEKVVI